MTEAKFSNPLLRTIFSRKSMKVRLVTIDMKVTFPNIFTFFYMHKKKVKYSRKFSTSGFQWIYMFWDFLNTIWSFLGNVYMYVSKVLHTLYLKNLCAEIGETFYSVAPWYNLVPI